MLKYHHILTLFFTAGMASMQQPHQLAGLQGGYAQFPQAVPNALARGYPPSQQSKQAGQIGLQRSDVEAFNRTSRSNKSTSEDEGGSDSEKDHEAAGRRQSLEDRSGGSSENDGGDVAVLEERVEKKKIQKKGIQGEREEMTNAVPSKMKKNRMQKKGSSSSSGSNQSEPKTVKFIQPELHQSLPVPGQGGAFISPPTPIPSGRVISSPLPPHPQQSDQLAVPPEKEGHSDNQNSSSKATEKDAVGDKKKKGELKGGKKKRSRSPSLERTQHHGSASGHLKGDNQGISEEQLFEDQNNSAVYGEVTMSRVESPPTLIEVEERSKFVQFPSPPKGVRRPVLPDNYEMGYDNPLTNGAHDM